MSFTKDKARSRRSKKITMATETTPEQLQAEKLERARKANEERNAARLARINAIADGNDAHGADEMQETDGSKLIMREAPTPEEREAAAAKQEMDAQQFLAEREAKALQEEGAAEEVATEQTQATDPTEKKEKVEAEAAPPDVKVVNGVTHYLTIVNGKEKWLTLEQLRTTAQKVESADEYLASAAASVRNTSRLDPSPEKDEPSRVEEVDLEKTLSSAVMGDEEAIKKLAAVFKGLKETQAKPSVVTPDVLQQFDERWSFRRAVEWFEDQYQDVLADPKLKKLVFERDVELAKEQPTMPYKQRLKAAGDEIRGWIQQRTGAAPVKAAASETKVDRKKTLVNVPSAAARQTPIEDEEAEESVEDAIQKMAKARGQPRAIVHGRTNQR
jgi:hypothetical protein